jgi:hypothetical protein
VANPQACFRVKAHLAEGLSYFRMEASTDGGLNWTERTEANLKQRHGHRLAARAVRPDLLREPPNVRLRFRASGYRYTPILDARLDKLTVGERTPTSR